MEDILKLTLEILKTLLVAVGLKAKKEIIGNEKIEDKPKDE